MNSILVKKGMIVLAALTLLFTFSFSSNLSASAANSSEVENLAEQLEFLMEEALIEKDGVRTFDFEKVESKFGEKFREELETMTVNMAKQSQTISKQAGVAASSGSFQDCMISALKDHFGVAIITAALEGGLWAYLEKKAYKEAAKLLLKFAVGTNAVALAATLIYYGGKCTYEHG